MSAPTPLELALQNLAKSMGVNLPEAQGSNNKSEQNETRPEVSILSDSEEGELSDNVESVDSPPVQSLRPPTPQSKVVKSDKNIRRPAPVFTGDIDAESLLRGPCPTGPRQKKSKVERTRPARTPPTERPKVPCRYWMEGKCSKGDECTFSHAVKPNKSTEEAKSTDVCRYHIAGNCLKGDTCMFSHDLSRVPCKFFHVKGECASGSACRFSHSPISEEERHLMFAELMGTRDPRLAATMTPSPTPLLKQLSSNPPVAAPKKLMPKAKPSIPNVILDPEVAKYNPFGSPF